MFPPLARAVDRLLSRGEGLDASRDPFGAPLDADAYAALQRAVREARFAEDAPPFTSAIPPPTGGARVPLVTIPSRDGHRWAILAPPYGSFDRRDRLGLYARHARLLHLAGFNVAAMPLPYH
ncbi:MAG: hypothetical protein ACYDCK_14325, partial [Thermoplasmatota archaeon]